MPGNEKKVDNAKKRESIRINVARDKNGRFKSKKPSAANADRKGGKNPPTVSVNINASEKAAKKTKMKNNPAKGCFEKFVNPVAMCIEVWREKSIPADSEIGQSETDRENCCCKPTPPETSHADVIESQGKKYYSEDFVLKEIRKVVDVCAEQTWEEIQKAKKETSPCPRDEKGIPVCKSVPKKESPKESKTLVIAEKMSKGIANAVVFLLVVGFLAAAGFGLAKIAEAIFR